MINAVVGLGLCAAMFEALSVWFRVYDWSCDRAARRRYRRGL